MDSKIIVDRIKKLTKARGITINKLLSDCELNSTLVANMQRKGTIPSAVAILKISKYFNVSMEYLLTGQTDQYTTRIGNVIDNPDKILRLASKLYEQIRRIQPDNRPLTLDELSEMNGNPVWIEQEGAPYPSGYGIVVLLNWGEINVVTLQGHDYGKTWVA